MKPAGRRRKGTNGERELVEVLQAAGLRARRVPLSGAMRATGFGGDVLVDDGAGTEAVWECKRRRGFVEIYRWLQEAQVLAFRGDRGERIVTLRLDDYLADRRGDGARALPIAADENGQEQGAAPGRVDDTASDVVGPGASAPSVADRLSSALFALTGRPWIVQPFGRLDAAELLAHAPAERRDHGRLSSVDVASLLEALPWARLEIESAGPAGVLLVPRLGRVDLLEALPELEARAEACRAGVVPEVSR